LFVNDQLTWENMKKISTDFTGYLHTAAYIGVLEAIGALR
jgi:hypothetical protein